MMEIFHFFIEIFAFVVFVVFVCHLLLLCGDVERNPGPTHQNRRCNVLFANIRGLHGGIKDLAVASRDCDIVLCAETLVSDYRDESELCLPYFGKPLLMRRGAIPRARGLSVYIRNGYAAYRQSAHECRCHETMIVRVCARLHNFYVLCCYRNPDSDNSIFECLLTSMASIQSTDRKAAFVFVGDFNAHHANWLNSKRTDDHGIAAFDFANVSGCTQLVKGPTHNLGGCLDLVLTDVPDLVSVTVNAPIGSSDHSSIKFSLQLLQSAPVASITKTVFLKSRVNWNEVCSDVRDLPWHNIVSSTDPVDTLNNAFCKIIEHRIPTKVIRLRSGDKPWFDAGCRHAHCEKQAAYRRWSRHRTRENWDLFIQARNAAEIVYSLAQGNYNAIVKDTLQSATQPHKWWSTLKSAVFGAESSLLTLLSPSGALVCDPVDKANLLMSHFDAKQSRASVELPATCHPEPIFHKFAFRSKEIKQMLDDLDSNGGTDPLGMFPLFFKMISSVLAPKLSIIFRRLIREGSFPSCWRTANITPIPKGAASPVVSNYRPISITPVLSKVFERLVASRLSTFLERSGMLPACLFAYRKGLGTCDALLAISHLLQNTLEHGSEARLVQIDFSAAFDRVNHRGLLYKLQSMGIGGSILSIISQFLEGRTHRVCVDGKYSSFSDVVSGVPQGSVLGPLLFILYTADMVQGIENNMFNYADDSTLVAVVPSVRDRAAARESLNRDLQRMKMWCHRWDMMLNPEKTKTMIVSRSRTIIPSHGPLLLDGVELTNSDSLCILGVTFDCKLTFEQHIRSITSAAGKKLGILRKCFKIFGDKAISISCFRCFILPLLEYCSPVWSSAAASHLKLLDKIISTASFLCGCSSLGNLSHRRVVGALCMLYKIKHNANHFLHSSLPLPHVPARMTRLAATMNPFCFEESVVRTEQYSRCFVPSTVRLWNHLPASVFDPGNLQGFKTRVNNLYANN